MQDMIIPDIQTVIYNWLIRKTTISAVRRIGELPLAIGSDIGVVRGENQDRVSVLRMQLGQGQYFIAAALCDGMGGMTEGAACASLAIARFFTTCIRHRDIKPRARLLLASQEANKAVHCLYQGKGGATLSAVLLESIGEMVGVNVGDSRIYKYQDNTLEQITVDDTIAGLLKNNLQFRNELLQFIGVGDGLEPHIIEIPAHESIILTSDGMHFMDKNIMQMVIQTAKDSGVAVRRLLEIAKWCGGRDNASAIAVSPFFNQTQLFDDPRTIGTIQIWDPYGELQISVAEYAGIGRTENELSNNRKPIPQEESPPKKNRSTKHSKKTKPEKGKIVAVVNPRKEEANAEKESLQLQIRFKGDKGKENHD